MATGDSKGSSLIPVLKTKFASYFQQIGIISNDVNSIQYIQTLHRLDLLHSMGLVPDGIDPLTHRHQFPDLTLLEIGSGQGDTTAVLAALTGPGGKIIAVDSSSPDYGAPQTLGEATSVLQSLPEIGSKIDFHFNVNLAQDTSILSKYTHIDGIIISHAMFYFSSINTLEQILRNITERFQIKSIFLAEWDHTLIPYQKSASTGSPSPSILHFLAVSILSKYSLLHSLNTKQNVNTVYTRNLVIDVLSQFSHNKCTNAQIQINTTVSNPLLHDGKWEVQYLLSKDLNESQVLTRDQLHYLAHEVDSLRQLYLASNKQVAPLDVFVIVATLNYDSNACNGIDSSSVDLEHA